MKEYYRRGRPVQKVTFELDRELYDKMIEQLNGETIRSWLTDALTRYLEKQDGDDSVCAENAL